MSDMSSQQVPWCPECSASVLCIRAGLSSALEQAALIGCLVWGEGEETSLGVHVPFVFSSASISPFPAFACPLIMGISQDCNQGAACSTRQQHQLEIDPDLAPSVTQASSPGLYVLLDIATMGLSNAAQGV